MLFHRRSLLLPLSHQPRILRLHFPPLPPPPSPLSCFRPLWIEALACCRHLLPPAATTAPFSFPFPFSPHPPPSLSVAAAAPFSFPSSLPFSSALHPLPPLPATAATPFSLPFLIFDPLDLSSSTESEQEKPSARALADRRHLLPPTVTLLFNAFPFSSNFSL